MRLLCDPFIHVKRILGLIPVLVLTFAIGVELLTACADRSTADDTGMGSPTWYTYADFRTMPETVSHTSVPQTSIPESEVPEQSNLSVSDTSEMPFVPIFTETLPITAERPATVSVPAATSLPKVTTTSETATVLATVPAVISSVRTPVSITTTTSPATDPLATDSPTSTAPVTVQVPSSDSGELKLISVTSPVGRNQKATVTVLGAPDTLYQISVYYSTTVSTAAGLEPKLSDSNGEVSWTWKIGGRTAAGTHKIVITGGGEILEIEFITVA